MAAGKKTGAEAQSVMPDARQSSGRRNWSHVTRTPLAPPKPPKGKVLPGETQPLQWHEGRDYPITDEEALGMLRRQQREDMQRRDGKVDESKVAKVLPDRGGPKTVTTSFRFTEWLRSRADSLAEMEGTNLTSIIEEMLIARVSQPPRDPHTARKQREELFEQLTGKKPVKGRAAARDEAEMDEIKRQLAELTTRMEKLTIRQRSRAGRSN